MSNSTSHDRQSQENPKAFLKNLVIPGIALHNPELDWDERATFAFLICVINSKGYCWWGNAKLAKAMKCSERTIRRRLEKFEKMGWIKRVEENGQRYIYDLTSKPYVVDNSLDIGDTPDTSDHPPGHACPPTPDTGDHQIYINEKNKEDLLLTPNDVCLFSDPGEEKIYRKNAKTSWRLNGLDQLFSELWEMTPKHDSDGWQLKDNIASLIRALKKIPESELVGNREQIRKMYTAHIQAHLEFKQNKEQYEGRSGFSNIVAWFQNECWKQDIAEAMGLFTLDKLTRKPQETINARTGKAETPQDRTRSLDRYDHAHLEQLQTRTLGMTRNQIDVELKRFCDHWSKNFEYVVSIFYSRYAPALQDKNTQRENHGRVETHARKPRSMAELFA